jgi:hypothetical protein
MEPDPFYIYGPNGRAVGLILDQAAEMTLDQMAATAKAMNSTTGYLAWKRSWRKAGRAVQSATKAHSRTSAAVRAKDDAMDSVIRAARRIAVSNQKSDAQIAACWQEYRTAITDAKPRLRQKAYRKLMRALADAIGSTPAKSLPLASGAASTAAQVAVVWDLASQRAALTPGDRDILMAPWLSAFPLPPDLAAR